MRLDRKTQLSIAYAILTILLLLVMQSYFEGQVDSVKYSDFRQWVVEGRVAQSGVPPLDRGRRLALFRCQPRGLDHAF